MCKGNCPVDCPANTYKKTVTVRGVAQNTCETCDPNCVLCSDSKCVRCDTNFFLLQGTCVKDCSLGFFKNPYTNNCDKCGDNCRSCDPNGSNLLDGFCYKQCLVGYRANNQTNTCEPCQTNCQNCDDDRTSCKNCLSGFVQKINSQTGKYTCENGCPDGNVMINGACRTDNCQQCSNNDPTICKVCKTGFFRKNGVCVPSCGTGFYSAPQTSDCLPCSTNCDTCNDSNKCLNCVKPKLLLNELDCVYVCPDGYVPVGSVCIKCKDSQTCRVCSASNTENCIDCAANFFLYQSGCVPTCPDSASFLNENLIAVMLKSYLFEEEMRVQMPNGTKLHSFLAVRFCSRFPEVAEKVLRLGQSKSERPSDLGAQAEVPADERIIFPRFQDLRPGLRPVLPQRGVFKFDKLLNFLSKKFSLKIKINDMVEIATGNFSLVYSNLIALLRRLFTTRDS